MLGQFGFRRGPPVTDGAAASFLYFAGAGRHLDRLLYRCECRCDVQRLVNHRADAVVGFRAFPVRLRLRTSDRRLSHVLTTGRTSFIGGGQVSFNYQFGMLVPASKPTFRLCRREAPYRRRFNPAPPPANFSAPVFGTATVARRLDYLGTARGSLGCPLVLRCSMQRAVWLTAAPILPIPGRSASPSHRRSSSAARPPTAEPASVTRSAAASNTPSGKTGPSRRSTSITISAVTRRRLADPSPISHHRSAGSRLLRCAMTATSFAPG